MREDAEELLDSGMTKIENAVGLMGDGAWGDSVLEAFRAARLHLIALLENDTGVSGRGGSLTGLLRNLEREGGGKLPGGLVEQTRRLDRMYVLVRKNLAVSLGWEDYPDEEQCAEMLHIARALIKYCRGRINRPNSFHFFNHNGSD